jgi:hypothetical protein
MARRRKRSKSRKGITRVSKSGIRYRKSPSSRTGWVKVGGKKKRKSTRRRKRSTRRSPRRRAPKRRKSSSRRKRSVRRNPFGGAWSMF